MLNAHKKVLIIDKDPIYQRTLSSVLRTHGIQSIFAHCGAQTMEKMHQQPDAIIMDPDLADRDEQALLLELRVISDLPILIHSKRTEDTFRISSLENGADGIMRKPCNPRELVARLMRLLHAYDYPHENNRRNPFLNTNRRLTFGHWTFDYLLRELSNNSGDKIELGVSEFTILNILLKHPQTVLSRHVLSDALKRNFDVKNRAVDVIVSKLRRTLKNQQDGTPYIQSLRTEGYMLAASVLGHKAPEKLDLSRIP